MIWTALGIGMLGSLHCAAMCGPFMLGLGGKNYNLFSLMIHHIGRWLGYVTLAIVFSLLVTPLQVFELQQYVALVSGILLILYGLKGYIKPVNRFLTKITSSISEKMANTRTGRTGNIFLGYLNGLLPCGFSFGTAILSVNTGSIANAALFMVLFGVGTLPVLLGISYLPRLGNRRVLAKFNTLTPKLILLAGFLLVIRSAGLGIPYLSPDYNIEEEKMECCEVEP
jgi:sulfite exporter TauE/SafE